LSDFLARGDGLVWLLFLIGPLLFVQRRLHFELQAVFLLMTRRPGVALGLFSLLFLPGVLLHETSHYLMARLLRVRTGRFSLLPQLLPSGKLQLGFVETEKSDFLRDALIGLAPLLTGGLAIAFLGLDRLGLAPLGSAFGSADWPVFWQLMRNLPAQSDFWLWFYLAFAISTTMLPSDSDRRAWLPLGLTLLGLIVTSLLAGAGPWLLENIAPWLNRGLRALSTVFGISLGIHIVLWLPLRLLREVICKVTGMRLRM